MMRTRRWGGDLLIIGTELTKHLDVALRDYVKGVPGGALRVFKSDFPEIAFLAKKKLAVLNKNAMLLHQHVKLTSLTTKSPFLYTSSSSTSLKRNVSNTK